MTSSGLGRCARLKILERKWGSPGELGQCHERGQDSHGDSSQAAAAVGVIAMADDNSDLDQGIAFAEMADEAIAALDLQRADAEDAVRAELHRQLDAVERESR
jgi:hypothetical protein